MQFRLKTKASVGESKNKKKKKKKTRKKLLMKRKLTLNFMSLSLKKTLKTSQPNKKIFKILDNLLL